MIAGFRQLAPIDLAQLDMDWIKRLFKIIDWGKQAIYELAALLIFVILLIVGNTLRLVLQNQQEEIEIMKLIGGTRAFIQRPFLYMGVLYGLIAGLIALALVYGMLYWLSQPLSQVIDLYRNQFSMTGLDALSAVGFIIISMLLTLLGSWIAVSQSKYQ